LLQKIFLNNIYCLTIMITQRRHQILLYGAFYGASCASLMM